MTTTQLSHLILQNVQKHVQFLHGDSNNKDIIDLIPVALTYLENKIDINKLKDIKISSTISHNEFQYALSKINELESIRKSNGVYYTPKDVINFININTFFFLPNKNSNAKMLNNFNEILSSGNSEDLSRFAFHETVLDPTCGTSEFLIDVIEKKIEIIQYLNLLTDENILKVAETIYGIDINSESITISKIRIFFLLIQNITNTESIIRISEILNRNFINQDFLKFNNIDSFNYIIGNPPYLEVKRDNIYGYGNLYASILHRSQFLLCDGGRLGFVIPISYISTPRMKNLRNNINNNSNFEIILSFADRPSSLFESVHQKLNILIIDKKSNTKGEVYTSSYNYWYKNERKNLFNNQIIYRNTICTKNFYPKISDSIQHDIFSKIYSFNEVNILSKSREQANIYISSRATFWIKSFTFDPKSKEYLHIKVPSEMLGFINILMNSSLFFWFWTVVSDGWHLTNKELLHFLVPKQVDYFKANKLNNELESKLEETKIFINTKQSEYAYQHKLAVDIIEKVDKFICDIYSLTKNETKFILNYAKKYRESRGN